MTAVELSLRSRAARSHLSDLLPGAMVAAMVCLAAFAVADRYDAPVMLFALLFGIALSFLAEDARLRPGISFTASTGLKLGIALMGAGVSTDILSDLGVRVIALTLGLSLATLALGVVAGRAIGWDHPKALVAAGSVAICGASAALALASVVPEFRNKAEHVLVVIVTATGLSTLAMVFYPVLLDHLGATPRQSGVVLGASIHDVAQVIGAGFSMTPEIGEIAILTKMIRVAFLPVVLLGVAFASGSGAPRARLRLPWFLTLFVVLMLCANLPVVPEAWGAALSDTSRGFLFVAVSALGLSSAPKRMLQASRKTMAFSAGLTAFLLLVAIAAARTVL